MLRGRTSPAQVADGVHRVCVDVADLDEWTAGALQHAVQTTVTQNKDIVAAIAEAAQQSSSSSSLLPPLTVHVELKVVYCGPAGLSLLKRVLVQQQQPSSSSSLYDISLTKLTITCKTFSDTEFTHLAEALLHPHCRVRVLDLDAVFAQRHAVYVLVELLEHAECRLEELYISSFGVSESGGGLARRLARTVGKPNGLVHLAVDALPDEALLELAEAVEMPTCRLQSMKMQTWDNGMKAWRRFLSALQHPNCALTRLDIGEWEGRTAEGGNNNADTLTTRSSPGGCQLVALVDALPATRLSVLALDFGSTFSTLGYTQLLARIPSFTGLRDLSLKHCSITMQALQDGLRTLASSISTGTSCWALERLDLSFTSLDNATELCRVLAHEECNIQSLDVMGTDLYDEGMTKLAESVERPGCTLRELSASYVLASQEGIDRLTAALKSPNCELVAVNVDNDALGDDEFDATELRQVLVRVKMARRAWALISARQVPRLGLHSSLRRIPVELVRMVDGMLYVAPPEEEEDEEEE